MITIQINIPLKTVRKAFVIADQDVPSDEAILEKLGNEPNVIDLSTLGPDGDGLALGLALIAIDSKFD